MPDPPLHFADPLWLWGLALLPFLPLLFAWVARSSRTTFALGTGPLLSASPGAFRAWSLPWALRLCVLGLCLIAAARPQSGRQKIEEKRPVTDLFVAFDVSSSMLTQDLKPDRVRAAKKFLARFLDEVKSVRVGVEVFARFPFTQCPMTTDLDAAKGLLSNIEVGSVKADGTAIGDALVACLGRLEKGTGQAGPASKGESPLWEKLTGAEAPTEEGVPSGEKGDHQAIVLLTDGGDNASSVPPLTAAQLAARQGVKIYAIGVGSEQKTLAIFTDDQGKSHYVVDPMTGQIAVQDPVDMGLLRQLADLTGGKAYIASDNAALRAVLHDIARLEKRDAVTVADWRYNELAPYFLLAALLLLVLDLGLELTFFRTLP